MAERALAFELQNGSLRMIRFNYFNPGRGGLLGATQLQTDISGLENTKLSFIKQILQLTHTISLARIFPTGIFFQTVDSSCYVIYLCSALCR